jgi:hypothetical protein
MKTKLLSLLMLISCTAVMFVGCKKKFAPTTCDECDEVNHVIEIDEAAKLIAAFHNNVVNDSEDRSYIGHIQNSGGIVDLKDWKSTVILGFKPIIMHLGFEPIPGDALNNGNLIVSVEKDNPKCIDKVYQNQNGDGFVSDEYFRSGQNIPSIAYKGTRIDENDVIGYLFRKFNLNSTAQPIDKNTAIRNESMVRANFPVGTRYNCKDFRFNVTNTLRYISKFSDNEKLVYFFGYKPSVNPTNTDLQIKIILVGIKDGKLLIQEGNGNSLMRDYSRPHP